MRNLCLRAYLAPTRPFDSTYWYGLWDYCIALNGQEAGIALIDAAATLIHLLKARLQASTTGLRLCN